MSASIPDLYDKKEQDATCILFFFYVYCLMAIPYILYKFYSITARTEYPSLRK